MNSVFLVADYYPKIDPSTNLAKKCISVLQEEHEVSVVAFAETKKNPIEIEGVRFYPQYSKREIFYKKHRDKKILQILYTVYSLLHFPKGYGWFRKKALKQLEEIEKKQHIDCLCAVSSPFVSFQVALKWKQRHPNCEIVTYTIDPYYIYNGKNVIQSKLKYFLHRAKKAVHIEEKVYHIAKKCMIFEAIESDKEGVERIPKEKRAWIRTQIDPTDYTVEIDRQDNNVSFVYTGGFYLDIRNPEYMLKTFLDLGQEYCVDLYTNDTCAHLLEKYSEESQGRIRAHAYLPRDEIKKKQIACDFLLSVGNSVAGFSPSKIYEYIATGKPIISFYKNGLRETCLDVYPLALQIDCDKLTPEQASREINVFVEANVGKRLTVEQIMALYPENTLQAFTSSVKEVFEKD